MFSCSQKKPWVELAGGYMFIGQLPNECRVRAPAPPQKKAECQVLLMVGMIGAGKSHWVSKKLNAEHGKHWNVIGTPELLNQMKVRWTWILTPLLLFVLSTVRQE